MFVLCACACSQDVTVTSNDVRDLDGHYCANCTITFAEVDSSGHLLREFGVSGPLRITSAPVVNGYFSIDLPMDTEPENVCFDAALTDNTTGGVVGTLKCLGFGTPSLVIITQHEPVSRDSSWKLVGAAFAGFSVCLIAVGLLLQQWLKR
jgi:hypothetical protein